MFLGNKENLFCPALPKDFIERTFNVLPGFILLLHLAREIRQVCHQGHRLCQRAHRRIPPTVSAVKVDIVRGIGGHGDSSKILVSHGRALNSPLRRSLFVKTPGKTSLTLRYISAHDFSDFQTEA